MIPKIWIVGGTSEARQLIIELAKLEVLIYVSVATEYGAGLIKKSDNILVSAERKDYAAMFNFIKEVKPNLIIDATHPYATIVTENLKNAAKDTNCE